MKLFQKFWYSIAGITTFVLLVVMLVYTYSLYNTQVDGIVSILDQQASTIGTMIDNGDSNQAILRRHADFCQLQEMYGVLLDRVIPENSMISGNLPMLQAELERSSSLYNNAVATSSSITQRISSEGADQARLIHGRPMPDGRYLLMLGSIPTLPSVLASQFRTILNLFLAALVLVTLFSAILAGSILKPIQEVDSASQQIAQGNLNVHIDTQGKDELASLGRSINSMSEQLQKSDNFKNEIISNVSHNLKTPIAAILTYAELLGGEQELSKAQQQEFINIIAARARMLEEMVKSLILLSKIQTGSEHVQLSSVDLQALCRSCIDGFSGLVERRDLSIELICKGRIDTVSSDADKLETVFGNLLSNAINHSYDGGFIMVELARLDDATRVTVRDTGEGIHPDDLPLIWDRFYKSPHSKINRDNGSGIGMHIVKGMFELLGYPHEIESELGSGTAVWFDIPDATAP